MASSASVFADSTTGGGASSSLSSSSVDKVVDDRTSLAYAEVVVSFVTAIALLLVTALVLLYRSSARHSSLLKVERQVRFRGAYILGQRATSPRRRIIVEGMRTHQHRIVDPPQYDRLVPAVVDARDSRRDCAEMLQQVRAILRRTEGNNAALMSMRCCVSCVTRVLPRDASERFLRIYEAIVFGSHHVCDDTARNVTDDDIRFMHAFFYNTLLKELS